MPEEKVLFMEINPFVGVKLVSVPIPCLFAKNRDSHKLMNK